jgi:hypothetical protein
MSNGNVITRQWKKLLMVVMIGVVVSAQSLSATDTKTSSNSNPTHTKKVSPYVTGGMPTSAKTVYALTAGIDQMAVRLVESGELVRFNYRVTDSTLAAPLGDKVSEPYLFDVQANVALQVPHMEKVGQLRQSGPQEVGKSYWMVFSNKGNRVKVGHKVSIVIGQFRVDGLVVQ